MTPPSILTALGRIGKTVGEKRGAYTSAQIAVMRQAWTDIGGALDAAEIALKPKARLVGINLGAGDVGYAGTQCAFIDRIKASDNGNSSGWAGSSWTAPDVPAPLDARGLPTAIPANCWSVVTHFPTDGTKSRYAQDYVVVTTKADAAIMIEGKPTATATKAMPAFSAAITDEGQQGAGGRGTVRITALPTPFGATESIAVVRADLVDRHKAGEVYDPDWFSFAKGFGVVRFLDWLGTNGSPYAKLADMPAANVVSYGRTTVPLAVCCATADVLGADGAELPIPHLMSVDPVESGKFITFIRDTMKAPYHLAVSNETWNNAPGYGQTAFFQQQGNSASFKAKALNADDPGTQLYAYTTVQRARQAIGIYAGQRQRLVTQIGVQTVSPNGWYIRKAGAQLAANELGLSGKTLGEWGVDRIQIAGYFGIPIENRADADAVVALAKAGNIDALFDMLQTGKGLTTDVPYGVVARVVALFRQWGVIATTEQMRLAVYEGSHAMQLDYPGPDGKPLIATTDVPYVLDARNRMRAHQRMADSVGTILDAFVAAGGTTFNWFGDFRGAWLLDSDWYVKEKATDPETPMTRKLAGVNGVAP